LALSAQCSTTTIAYMAREIVHIIYSIASKFV
jgi:hypothetical protein